MTLPPPLDWQSIGIGPGPDVPPDYRVTRENWRLYPFSRWSFQHTRELVPSRPIPASDTPRPIESALRDFSGLTFDDGEGKAVRWPDFLERTYTDAFLVLHRGRIIFEHYANGMTSATPHMLFSITKSLIGLVAERLIAAGGIDPSATVADRFPDLAETGFGPATLRHLLDMTDGTAFDENYADPDAEVHLYSAAYWRPERGLEGVAGALPKLRQRNAAPGTLFQYRTPVADMVGLMLRRMTGKTLAALVTDLVWQPAGCGDEAYMLLDTAGMEIAATGFNATVRDLARLGLWLTTPDQHGLLDGLLSGGDRALFEASPVVSRTEASYRSFWWIGHDRFPSLAALGVFGQRLYIEPESGLIVARVGSHPVATNQYTDTIHRNAIAALREMLA